MFVSDSVPDAWDTFVESYKYSALFNFQVKKTGKKQ
jgi:hypothetical protein